MYLIRRIVQRINTHVCIEVAGYLASYVVVPQLCYSVSPEISWLKGKGYTPSF